jgi:ATP-dependent RNA helicase DOB1
MSRAAITIIIKRSVFTLEQGSLVRAIRRLEELLVQLSGGLRSIGDMEMAENVEKAAEKIKRDVIFAASLFL